MLGLSLADGMSKIIHMGKVHTGGLRVRMSCVQVRLHPVDGSLSNAGLESNLQQPPPYPEQHVETLVREVVLAAAPITCAETCSLIVGVPLA